MTRDQLLGVWRRELIAWPDGRRDTTTSVHWVQTRTAFADLRLPAGERTNHMIEGFAGHITLAGDICTWHRRVDFQPPGAPPDMGRLHFENEVLIEHGLHLPYMEHWRRIDDGTAGLLVLELTGANSPGLIVRCGGHVMRAIAGGKAAEISHAYTQTWQIHASTLTGHEGETLGFQRNGDDFLDRQGRRWRLTEASTDPGILLPL